MIPHPPNGRAYIIKWQELRTDGNNNAKEFLWYCFKQFKALVEPKNNDDLVLMWKSDFDELYNNYRPNKSSNSQLP